MGSGASTTNTQRITYRINGNGVKIGDDAQKIGTATASATNDVSPKTHMNYSEDINLSWNGVINAIPSGSLDAITGTVPNNTQLLQTAKVLGAAAMRVGVGDKSFRQKVVGVVDGLLGKSVKDGVDKIITSASQVSTGTIKNIVDMQIETVNKMVRANDDYQTVALGLRGMRNNEVSTDPTHQSIEALAARASDLELSRKDEILQVGGPRVGIIPYSVTEMQPDIIKHSLDTAITEHGRVADLRINADEITKESKAINFSTLHGKGASLARGGLLKIDHWETAQFVGPIIERLPYYNGSLVPGGIIIDKDDEYDNQNVEKEVKDNDSPMVGHIANTPYAYDLAEIDSSRETRMLLSGTISITKQVYDAENPIEIGVIVRKTPDSENGIYHKGVFINTEVHMEGNSITNVHDDVSRMLFHAPDENVAETGIDLNELAGDVNDELFSYISNFQIAVNITDLAYLQRDQVEPLRTDDPGRGKLTNYKLVVAVRKHGIKLNVSLQTPIIEISVTGVPNEMKYLGLSYAGTVLDLLGEVPDWYQTEDPHDPINIYTNTIASIVLRAGRISELHIKDGASYNLTKSHVRIARSESGLSQLTDSELDEHIHILMLTCGKWMYVGSEIAKYRAPNRKRLFMRLIENVAFQSLYHISIISQSYSDVITEYLKDCNDYNLYEERIDREDIKAFRARMLR